MNASAYFLYARKSTDVEDKQVLSIDAQLFELRDFAKSQGLNIVAEYVEKQSAKTPGRPIFNQMLARVEAGEAAGILAWHPDRLARNSVDGGKIIYLLDTGTLRSLKFPRTWFENTPQGKLMLHNEFGFSKYYVDSLAENTKRGLREKVRRGEYPGAAPFGYLNDYRTKRIIIDRERAPLVREVYETYATGTVTLDFVRQFLGKRGVRTRNGKLMTRAFVSWLVSNPFYYGHFRYAGEVYAGVHEPIISKALFDRVQEVLHVRRRRVGPVLPQSDAKPLLGLLHCAECGGAITAEIQKGHTYYRCTKKIGGRKCSQPYVREEVLAADLTDMLRPYALRADWAEAMLKRVKEEETSAAQSAASLATQKRGEIDQISGKLQRLLDGFLDGAIDRDAYLTAKASLMGQKKTLEEQRVALARGQPTWLEPFKNWILTAKNAGQIAVTGTLQEKKVLARKVFGSNLVLDRKKARGSALNPWSFLLENHACSEVVGSTGFEPVTPSV
jgi:site-specific DNA recombinase